jgi:RNA polymerase sigma factor (sigma-70 family)
MRGRLVATGDIELEDPGPTGPGLRAVPTFEEVYRATFDRMTRVAFMMTGSNEAAEDIVQDAFVGLYGRFARLDEPVPYLHRSVVNGCLSRGRRIRVAQRLQHLTVGDSAAALEVDDTWGALARLAPRPRAAVVLRFYADLPLAEIAEILDCRTGTVKSMLSRALGELRAVIKP